MKAKADIRHGFKVFTHDWRSPLQGGDPIKVKSFPHALPTVKLDTSTAECGPGWNFCGDPATAFRIAGLWPTGRPSRLTVFEASEDAIARGDKRRASSGTILGEATEAQIEDAIRTLSIPFGEHAEYMAQEQILWRKALARPYRIQKRVEEGLLLALKTRGLEGWKLKIFSDEKAARDARDAWDAWAARDARAARAARDARDAWDAWAARDARAARDAWDARAARAARAAWAARAARDAWDAWAAWGAWDALTVSFASRKGWISTADTSLSLGVREAYLNGLEVAVPVASKTLGYAMAEEIPDLKNTNDDDDTGEYRLEP
jgi:hypothetical protein